MTHAYGCDRAVVSSASAHSCARQRDRLSLRHSRTGAARTNGVAYNPSVASDHNRSWRMTMSKHYDSVYARSVYDPEGFWAEAADEIHWYRKWDKVLDDSKKPFYRWFAGAEVNTCYNAVDRHVASGRGGQTALIYDSPVSQTISSFTFRELLERVAKCAGALASLGVSKGDRIIVYMPMIPEAVITMLAAARLGAIHSVVFGGFASHELAGRIDDAKPKVIVSASCGIEPGRIVAYKPLLDDAITMSAYKPTRCIVYQRPMQ